MAQLCLKAYFQKTPIPITGAKFSKELHSDIDVDKFWQQTTAKGGQWTQQKAPREEEKEEERMSDSHRRYYKIISIIFYESTLKNILHQHSLKSLFKTQVELQ